jgi:hypothetical protein
MSRITATLSSDSKENVLSLAFFSMRSAIFYDQIERLGA